MSSAVSSIFFLLLVKHCIIVLWLQSLLTYKEKKSVYTSLSAQVHYLQHGFGTLFVLLFFIPWQYAIAIGLFDFSVGTTLETNMISLNKTRYLEDKFGDLIFDYIGDSKKDIPIWESAKTAYVVNNSNIASQLKHIEYKIIS